ncbi:MAG: phosphoribosylanthranilate isomerase [Dehalococcoidia bacterium]
MTVVKICGVRDPESAVATVEAGADIVGVVFAESKRQVTVSEARKIIEAVRSTRRVSSTPVIAGPGRGEVRGSSWFHAWAEAIEDSLPPWRPLIAGVFARQPIDAVQAVATELGLDLVQLSGGEDEQYVRSLRAIVVRSIHVTPDMTADDVRDRAAPGVGAVVMLDTGGAGADGGTGTSFDWAVAADVGAGLPIMLAGGLTPENIADAIEQVRPWAVDVSSGVETGGTKDIEKVRAFVRAAKGASRRDR